MNVQQYFRGKKSVAAPLVGPAFISTWNTANTSGGSSESNQVTLPLRSTGIYDFVVDWGDGNEDTITAYDQSETTHTYASSGTYTISITGQIEGWVFEGTGDRLKILEISQWGSIVFLGVTGTNFGTFYGCSNLDVTATDTPTFGHQNAGFAFFRSCASLVGNSSFNNWDVSIITNFASFFTGCPNFNQPIGNWDVSNSISFSSTFNGCAIFNQNLSLWDTGNATNMVAMFQSSGFNNGGDPGINNWDVSKVTSFGGAGNNGMFRFCPFNQPIGGWNVTAATVMQAMFLGSTSFNQNIGGWAPSNVTNWLNFGTGFSSAYFSTSNLDAIFNGWTDKSLRVSQSVTFGTAQYAAAGVEGRALLTRTNSTVSVSNVANNGSGAIRITTGSAHGLTTGNKIFISGVLGTLEANGGWIVTVIDATTLDLQGSIISNAYTSGGTLRTGYGWTITDGGIAP